MIFLSAVAQRAVSKNFEENVEYLLKALRVEKSFDVIHRKFIFGERKFAFFFVDGFAKDVPTQNILENLKRLNKTELKDDPIDTIVQRIIAHTEVETSNDLEECIAQVLSGQGFFIVEDCNQAIIVDIREYPSRSPEEPDIERVVRGSRDGFVETMVFNTALIRRRIRDRSLCMEYIQAGRRSKTDIVLAYIDSIVDPDIVEVLRTKINEIEVDGLPMADKTIEEYIFGHNMNPYPLVRFTERPDTAAIHLLEGHVLLIVDGSPSVMICPTTFWHHLQHAEEYRQKPIVGAFLRWVRFAAIAASLFLLPLWYVVSTNTYLLTDRWKFIGPEEIGHISLIWQFLIAEVGIEVLRMAAIHTPNALATALGLVAAILIGEVAVDVGVFSKEVILYIAVAATGTFATPSYELSLANRLFRIFFLIGSAILGMWGLIIAISFWVILLASTKALHTPYLWPLIPFNARAMWHVLFRTPIPTKHKRPTM